jgi:hypothetical protein
MALGRRVRHQHPRSKRRIDRRGRVTRSWARPPLVRPTSAPADLITSEPEVRPRAAIEPSSARICRREARAAKAARSPQRSDRTRTLTTRAPLTAKAARKVPMFVDSTMHLPGEGKTGKACSEAPIVIKGGVMLDELEEELTTMRSTS